MPDFSASDPINPIVFKIFLNNLQIIVKKRKKNKKLYDKENYIGTLNVKAYDLGYLV